MTGAASSREHGGAGACRSGRHFKRPESVLVLVATRGGEVLLLTRRQPPGFRQSVTGSLHAGESPRDAALRELYEETGIETGAALEDLQMGARFRILPEWRARFAPGVRENREYWFRLRLPARVAVKINPREHVGYAWVPARDACALTASWSNRAALEHFVLSQPKSG